MIVPWQTNMFLKHNLVMKLLQSRIQRRQIWYQVMVLFTSRPNFSSCSFDVCLQCSVYTSALSLLICVFLTFVDDTNPFVKRAHKLLAGIPAAPAFASEFPTKEFALGLHPAAQPSNSAHVTAGMISITDITFRGNAMDWMVGKNGGFNTIMSTGFSQHDVNSAALVPISGLVCSKTAFVLSHGWIYLMGFSVLILSLTFKIGSFMYTGK